MEPEPRVSQPQAETRSEADAQRVRESPGDDGERSLIRWMLSLTPAQRLEVLQRHVDALERLGAGA
jgi:hypothetical protein